MLKMKLSKEVIIKQSIKFNLSKTIISNSIKASEIRKRNQPLKIMAKLQINFYLKIHLTQI